MKTKKITRWTPRTVWSTHMYLITILPHGSPSFNTPSTSSHHFYWQLMYDRYDAARNKKSHLHQANVIFSHHLDLLYHIRIRFMRYICAWGKKSKKIISHYTISSNSTPSLWPLKQSNFFSALLHICLCLTYKLSICAVNTVSSPYKHTCL